MAYPHKWSPVSYRSSVGQGKFYHCATQPNVLLCCDDFLVTGLNKWIAVFSVGIVCTFYTTIVSFSSCLDTRTIVINFCAYRAVNYCDICAYLMRWSCDMINFIHRQWQTYAYDNTSLSCRWRTAHNMLWSSVRPSVRHKSEFYQIGQTRDHVNNVIQ